MSSSSSFYVPLKVRKRLAEEKLKGKISKLKTQYDEQYNDGENNDIQEEKHQSNSDTVMTHSSSSPHPPSLSSPSPSSLFSLDTFHTASSSSPSHDTQTPSLLDISLSIRLGANHMFSSSSSSPSSSSSSSSSSSPAEDSLLLSLRKTEESELLRHLTSGRAPLTGVKVAAQGIKFTHPMNYGWFPLWKYTKLTEKQIKLMRKKHAIEVIMQHKKQEEKDNENANPPPSPSPIPFLSTLPCVPPCLSFSDMRLPPPFLLALSAKGISSPTPIQKQAIPAILSGRDLIGIANTGQGKSIAFVIPMLCIALRAECQLPLQRGEGPIGIIIAPSRELAKQTYDVAQFFNSYLEKDTMDGKDGGKKYPKLNIILLIGGIDNTKEVEMMKTTGIHCVICTPGKLLDMLKRHRFTLSSTQYIVLDEADRLIDVGFDETIKDIFNHFGTNQRSTALFSATMPQKIRDFAVDSLTYPVIVNVAGRAGAANLNITQCVEYVKEEHKLPFLLECLQRTAPPVLIFASRPHVVDEINEYLLLRGIASSAIHGQKEQQERNEAIENFKSLKSDILVATDVASKGLDFPLIQHVINYDMPSEIENYIHRIGRTGRGKEKGMSTTIINREVEESVLIDLKYVLREAKQFIPPFLQHLAGDEVDESGKPKECQYCGGLGHTIATCRKLREENSQKQKNQQQAQYSGRDQEF